jgi:hypothetical protein
MDLEKIISTHIGEYYGWLDYYAQIVVFEFNRFMLLNAEQGCQLVGPEDIEKCWQALVLDTELYYKYCMGKFGQIIHYKILNLDSTTRFNKISQTFRLYLQKYGRFEYKIVWSQSILDKQIKHNINYEISINIYSKSGTKYLTFGHKFNSVEIFGHIKEYISQTYNLPIGVLKIYICKIGIPDFIINNVSSFYSLNTFLEIPDQTNISGLFKFGIKNFDLIIQ